MSNIQTRNSQDGAKHIVQRLVLCQTDIACQTVTVVRKINLWTVMLYFIFLAELHYAYKI